jgi:hypothetical protein
MAGHGMARPGTARRGKARQGEAWQGMARISQYSAIRNGCAFCFIIHKEISTMKMQDVTLTLIEDAAHEWMQVPRSHLKALGIAGEITPYSYQNGSMVFLECDLDYSTYINARREKGWPDIKSTRRYYESWIGRERYPSYKETGSPRKDTGMT